MIRVRPPALLLAVALASGPAACGDLTGSEVDANRFTEVAAGDRHTCAVTVGGATLCWGSPENARLGRWAEVGADGCVEGACGIPVRIEEDLRFTRLSAGEAHTCGLSWDRVYCWGQNRFGQLGDAGASVAGCLDYVPFRCSPYPLPVALGFRMDRVTAARMHTCALTVEGRALCWGWNIAGQLGVGSKSQDPYDIPRFVDGGLRFVDLSTGYGHTCAVAEGGDAYCWGAGARGRLGTGAEDERLSPAPVAGGLAFSDVSAGGAYTCGVTADGGVYCWGWGAAGRLGTGSQQDRLVPTPALMPEPAVAIQAGRGHTCAIAASGALYCWGENSRGQLGTGDQEHRLEPARVLLDDPVARVSVGWIHTCAITTDDRLYCWGSNSFRQLGDGTGHSRTEPTPINP